MANGKQWNSEIDTHLHSLTHSNTHICSLNTRPPATPIQLGSIFGNETSTFSRGIHSKLIAHQILVNIYFQEKPRISIDFNEFVRLSLMPNLNVQQCDLQKIPFILFTQTRATSKASGSSSYHPRIVQYNVHMV